MTDIKVGSEWEFHGLKYRITAVGENLVLLKGKGLNEEYAQSKRSLIRDFKPAPVRRTVWLNVYEDFATCNNTKEQADMVKGDNVLFQQEVEIVDPRGDK